MQFFAEAHAPKYLELLWSLLGIYNTLLEKEKDGEYFLDAYALMDLAAHLVTTTNALDWMKYPELSHKMVYEDLRIVA